MTTSICVNFKFAEEWHVFSSDQLPGLYVASRNAEVAFKDVATAIEKLVFLNEGVKIKAVPELSFKDFIEQTQSSKYEEIIVLSDKRFSIVREAALA